MRNIKTNFQKEHHWYVRVRKVVEDVEGMIRGARAAGMDVTAIVVK